MSDTKTGLPNEVIPFFYLMVYRKGKPLLMYPEFILTDNKSYTNKSEGLN
ncbi:hypothetical protein [Roseivirga seohaensis]